MSAQLQPEYSWQSKEDVLETLTIYRIEEE